MLISPTGHHNGFTLHELLVTLVIILIMCGVVAVAIEPALEEASLRSATSTAIGQLQFARSYAIAHRTSTAVFFDTTKLGMAVMSATAVTSQTSDDVSAAQTSAPVIAGSDTNWQPVTTPAARYQPLPDGITFTDVSLNTATGSATTSSNATYTPVQMTSATPILNGTGDEGQLIIFSPLGQGQDASITLQDARGHTRTILVDALTGRCDLANISNDQSKPTLPNP